MGKRLCVIIFLFFLVFFIKVSAQEKNLTEKEQTMMCLENSEVIMQRLEKDGFSITRVNDTLKEAKLLFIVQEEIEKKGLKPDYKKILSYCEEIKKIEKLAYEKKDQIKALIKFYEEYGESVSSPEIKQLFSEINKEMKNERYEFIEELIEKTYNAITNEQAKRTLLATYYSATTKGMKSFLQRRWKEISLAIVVMLFVSITFHKPIRRYVIKQKINYLKMRREKIKEMITKIQDSYFNKGKISQLDFEIKNKRFAESIRDINRQISLLEEQLKKVERKNATQNTKDKKR
ncbi:MAG: hypothetical protein QXX68_01820 [Candidatus Pacearchaeota archaeon]